MQIDLLSKFWNTKKRIARTCRLRQGFFKRLNRQVRKVHQAQENKDLKRVFLAEDFCSESRASTFGKTLPEKDDFNRNGSAADIDELETKLFRQMDGMHAGERGDLRFGI